MRRFYPLIAALTVSLATASAGFAQTTLSVHGGVSLATLGGSDVESADTRTGLAFGGAVTFPVAPSVGIRLGANYVQKGATETEQGVEIKVALDYIEIPLLLRLSIPSSGSISPHFFVGPAVTFEANCEVEGSSQGATITVDCGAGDLPTKSVEFGAMAGAGLDIGTPGPLSITLDAFFSLGLSSIDDSGVDADVKNRAWTLLAGVAFPLG